VIREEAVKAAVKAFRDAHEAAEKAWMEQPGAETPNLESYLRAALEAAAPHMLAGAFDEAADAWGEAVSWSDSRPSPEQVQRWLRSRANTYRTPNAR